MIDTFLEYLSAESTLNKYLEQINDFLWGWNFHSIIIVLVLCGVYFTVKTRFVQFRMIGEMFRLLVELVPKGDSKHHVSSFQAF